MSAPEIPEETANIHLKALGQERVFPVTFQPGQHTIRTLVPVAQQIGHEATATALKLVEEQGRSISCRAGCGACCRQLVFISLVEAQMLAELVASMPPERQAVIRDRFADAVRRLEAAGLLDPNEPKGARALLDTETSGPLPFVPAIARRYFKQAIPCPFLEEESCSIHPHRPLVCREYHVTSPAANCAHLYEGGVDAVTAPVHMGDVLTEAAHKLVGLAQYTIPLTLALEWSEAHPGALEKKVDSLEMLRTLMGEIDKAYTKAFDQRKEQ